MPMTDSQMRVVRSYIGDTVPPEDFDLDEIFDSLATPTAEGVAYEVLQKRLADYLAEPASYSITGVYQESSQANITALQNVLSRLAKALPATTTTGGSIVSVSRLVRKGPSR